jgi:ankyrin repeat protein
MNSSWANAPPLFLRLLVLLSVLALLSALALMPAANATDISQDDLDESLVNAAGQGDMNSFNIALALGANLNAVDRRGNNAVLAATQGNRAPLLRTLLDKGVNPDVHGSSGFTPLTFAAMDGSLANVQLLLKAGANPNQRNALGETPLHLAARFGHSAIIKLLVAAGTRLDDENAASETPLITAILANKLDAFETLMTLGANPNVIDANNQSALYLAILEDHELMAHTLIERGARFDPRPRQYTPLKMARFMGHVRVVDALVRRGASE